MNRRNPPVERLGSSRRLAALSLSAVLSFAALGCRSGAREDERRELLTPVDTKGLAEARRQARQVFDERGELLESKEVVAGITLPKGLERTWHKDHRWVYETRRIEHTKLADYFSRRLMSTTVDRREDMVIFGGAVPVKDLKAFRMRVEVQRLNGHETASRVVIEQYQPFKPVIPPDQAQAQLEAARKRAD
jgi:hypothetical protein